MKNEDNIVILIMCVAIVAVVSWVGYYHVNKTNVEGRVNKAVVAACQTEPDTDVVECAYDTKRALDGKKPDRAG